MPTPETLQRYKWKIESIGDYPFMGEDDTGDWVKLSDVNKILTRVAAVLEKYPECQAWYEAQKVLAEIKQWKA